MTWREAGGIPRARQTYRFLVTIRLQADLQDQIPSIEEVARILGAACTTLGYGDWRILPIEEED